MLSQIEKVFNDQIRPALAQHGGNVEVVDVDNNILYVKFFGGCQGCSSSKATLKGGIEQLIKQHFPDIQEVVDVTDHQSGSNPYM
jgi:Fe-S cluster biogenesis protein NfuA